MNSTTNSSAHLTHSYLYCILVYVVAGLMAVGAGYFYRNEPTLWMIAWADIAATLIVFGFSMIFNNSSFYDPYWSVIPPFIALFYIISPEINSVNMIRSVIILILITLWGIRLTHNWGRGWRGVTHEDWRYIDLKHKTGKFYWAVSLSGIHLFPTVLVYLGCLPLYPAMSQGSAVFNWLDIIAIFVCVGAIVIEGVADNQLLQYKKEKRAPEEFLASGLWAYTRHPNYFGEVSFWWGIGLFALAVDLSNWWTLMGALAMTLLFLFISIPMIDKRMVKKRPYYQAHMRKVSALVPWFPKK